MAIWFENIYKLFLLVKEYVRYFIKFKKINIFSKLISGCILVLP